MNIPQEFDRDARMRRAYVTGYSDALKAKRENVPAYPSADVEGY